MYYLEETARLLSELSDRDLLRIYRIVSAVANLDEGDRTPPSRADDLSEAWIGKKVRFGRLPEDEFFYDGVPELTWTVLDIRFDASRNPDCRALLLSDAIIEDRTYGSGRNGSFWGGSQIRGWLNGEFVTGAFWGDEARRIVETGHEVRGGAPLVAVDRVFLLGEDELIRHLPDPSDRVCEDEDGAPREWWLRCDSAAEEGAPVPYVSESGHIAYAETASQLIMGVRPALWVSLGPARP